MNALVIEDSATIRTILKQLLSKMGFDVVEAANGREALDRLKQMAHVDVALVDWNMPEMNGLDFVRSVRADRAYDMLPLVMVTTNSEREHVEEALAAGANAYVMKPFPLDRIREELKTLGILD